MGLSAQVEAFMLTLILGILAGMIFHLYQLTIKIMRLGQCGLFLMDLIIWLVMIVVIFAALLIINQGEMRVYVFIALVGGIILYRQSMAEYFRKPLQSAANITVESLRTVTAWGLKPLLAAVRLVRSMVRRHPVPPPDDGDANLQ